MNIVFEMIELVELVLILAEFCAKLIEFDSGESRWLISEMELFLLSLEKTGF